ncbi:MAG: hypothetical protein KC609_17820 [Myxococcales bacterium]|nr:hypothetical protein [Myxococcales bacterium]
MAVDPSEQKTVMRPAFDDDEAKLGPQYEKTAMLQSPMLDEAAPNKRPVGLYVVIGLLVAAVAALALFLVLR